MDSSHLGATLADWASSNSLQLAVTITLLVIYLLPHRQGVGNVTSPPAVAPTAAQEPPAGT